MPLEKRPDQFACVRAARRVKRHGIVPARPGMRETLDVTDAHDRLVVAAVIAGQRAVLERFEHFRAMRRTTRIGEPVQTQELDRQLIGVLRCHHVIGVAVNDQRRHAGIRARLDQRIDRLCRIPV